MFKTITERSMRLALAKANELKLKREDIVSIIPMGDMIHIIYWQ